MGIPITEVLEGSVNPPAIFWGGNGGSSPTFNPSATPSGSLSGNTVCVPFSSNVAYAPGSGPIPNQPPSWNIPQTAPPAPQSEEFEFLERPGLRRLSSRARFTSVPSAKNTEETRPAGPGGGTLLGGRSRTELSATQQFYLAAKGLLE